MKSSSAKVVSERRSAAAIQAIKAIGAVALIMSLLGAGLTQASAAVEYIITDLGTLGGDTSFRTGINDSGQVTGTSYLSNNSYRHAFLWTPGGDDGAPSNPQMKDLGTLGGHLSFGGGISDSGQVVGWSQRSGNFDSYYAFLWTPGGDDGIPSNPQMKDLGTLGGLGSSSWGYGINTGGQVVGLSTTSDNPAGHAFLWTSGGTGGPPSNPQMEDLGTLDGVGSAGQSTGYGINAGGQIGGISLLDDLYQNTFLWTPGGDDGVPSNPQMKDLGTLGGLDSGSTGYGINDSGQVTGWSTPDFYFHHAFLWTPGGNDGVPGNPQMKDLGTLGGLDSQSYGYGINAGGQVVGTFTLNSYNNYHAFLYTGGVMRDLNRMIPPTSGWELQGATGINDRGQIVGEGTIGGQVHAFLLTPKPTLYAVLIGGTGGGGVPERDGPADVVAIRAALRQFGNVKPEKIIAVTSSSGVREEVLGIRSKILPWDSFLFYYGGHGNYTDDDSEPWVVNSVVGAPSVFLLTGDVFNTGDEYLCINGRRTTTPGSDYLTDDELADIFRGLPDQVHKLAVLDACMSAGFWGPDDDDGDLDHVPKTAILASSWEDSFSKYDGDSGRGYFSIALELALNDLWNTPAGFTFSGLRSALNVHYHYGNFPVSGFISNDAPWLDNSIEVPTGDLSVFAETTADFDQNTSLVGCDISLGDSDGDAVGDVCDNCFAVANFAQTNTDGDGFGDECDNCPSMANESQIDTDGDSIGDACDPCTDMDGDGFGDPGFPANTCPQDNCPTVADPNLADTDGDGVGDECDNCVDLANAEQTNTDGDGMGDVCDDDDDSDGWLDVEDPCPTIFNLLLVRGDLDCNDLVDENDIPLFVAVLLGEDVVPSRIVASDVNYDGVTDGLDIVPMIGMILGT